MRFLRNLAILIMIAIISVTAYWMLLRPRMLGATATDEERAARLPGDELVPDPVRGYTYAITIAAPPEKVWPWLVQTGYKRAGWYTFDWFYELTGSAGFVDGHSSNRVVPELQNIQVGDEIRIHQAAPFKIALIDAPRTLILRAEGDDKSAPDYQSISWAYSLQATPDGGTRLIVRWRNTPAKSFGMKAMDRTMEVGSFIMQNKMLQGIKQRVEAAE